MLRISVLMCLLASGVCEQSSPVRHRRPASSNFFRAQSPHDQDARSNQASGDNLRLLDLSGVFSGTWIKLERPPHSKSSSTTTIAVGVAADAATTISSTRVELPSVLMSSGSGKLMLHLTAGPTPRGEELAGIEGVLQLSDSPLLIGPGLQQLDLSGITRMNTDGQQALHAVLKPQQPVFAARTSSISNRRRGVSRRVQDPEDDQSLSSSVFVGSWIRGRQQRQQQRQHQQELSLSQQQVWLRGRRGPVMPAAGAAHQQPGPHTLYTSTGAAGDVAMAGTNDQAGTPRDGVKLVSESSGTVSEAEGQGYSEVHRGLSEQPGARRVRCRFRLELAVIPAADAETATTAAVEGKSSRSIKAEVIQLQAVPEQQHQQNETIDDRVVADVTSDSLAALYGISWQEAVGRAPLMQQQQQQQDQPAVPTDLTLSAVQLLEVPEAAGDEAQLSSQPEHFPAAPAVPAAAVAEEAVEALHSTAATAAAAAAQAGLTERSGSSEQMADVAASTASGPSLLVQEVDLPPLDPAAQLGSGDGFLRTLQSRGGLPGLQASTADSSQSAAYLEKAPAAAGNRAQSTGETLGFSAGQTQPVAPYRQAAPASGRAKQRPPFLDLGESTTSAGPVSLIDYWMLPCTHPQQRNQPHCRQQQRQQQRMVIQGLLLSDNCNASWSITAVALPPGGVERQAMCYAISALLLCLAQVVLLRKQARQAHASPAAALKLSLVGVCAGSQLDACLSMAHLAAALAAPDISLPLLVVAAAQFALFAGADMTLLLHVWRAHTTHSTRQRQQQQGQQPGMSGNSTGFDGTTAAAVGGGMTAAPPAQWPHQWSAALAAVAGSVAGQLQEQAEGLREFSASSSGSSLIDVLLSGLVQLLTGQSLVLLYVRFYLVLLAATLISWSLASQIPLLLLVAFSFWTPQILHNIQHTTRQALMPAYIIAASMARLLLPLYLLSCPHNMLQLAPQSWLAVAVAVWLGMQVVVLLLQHYIGPHVLLPLAWVPDRYNYHRVELPWQFKQQIAEMHKLGQQQQLWMAPAACNCISQHRCHCHECHRLNPCHSRNLGHSVTAGTLPTIVRQQQQWHCMTGVMAPSSGNNCCCCFRCSMVPTSGQPASLCTTESELNRNSCWGSFSDGGSSSSSHSSVDDFETPQQQPVIPPSSEVLHELSAGGGGARCNQRPWQQQQQQQEALRHSEISLQSDAVYISMLGAPAAAAPPPPSHQQRQRQQEPCLEPSHQPMIHASMLQPQVQQQQRCRYHTRCQHCPQSGALSPKLAHKSCPDTPAALAADGSNRGSILAQSSSSSSSDVHQTWLDRVDHLLHDVAEGYDVQTGQGVVECVICMAGVTLLPVNGRCVTPCGHFFHTECLANWVQVKAECPTCRGPLPPL